MLLREISVAELLQKDVKALATDLQQRQREEAIERGKRARTIVGGDERPQIYRAGSLQPVGGDVAGVLSHEAAGDDAVEEHASNDISPDARRLTLSSHDETSPDGRADDLTGLGQTSGFAASASLPSSGELPGGAPGLNPRMRPRGTIGAACKSTCSASGDDDDDDDDLPISQWSTRPAAPAPATAPITRAAPRGGEHTDRAARNELSPGAAGVKRSDREDMRVNAKRPKAGTEGLARDGIEAEKAAICAVALQARRALEGERQRPSERPPAMAKQGLLGGFELVPGLGGPISRQPSAASVPAVSRQSSLAASLPSVSRQPSSIPPERPSSRQVSGFASAPGPVNLGHGAAAYSATTTSTGTGIGADIGAGIGAGDGTYGGGPSASAFETLQAELGKAREQAEAARQREKAVRAQAKATESAAAERERALLERVVLAEARARKAEEALTTMRQELAEAAQAAVLDDHDGLECAMYDVGMATDEHTGTGTYDGTQEDVDDEIIEVRGCAGGRLRI